MSHRGSPSETRAFACLARAGLAAGARVLVLGSGEPAATPAGCDWRLERRAALAPLPDADGAFDAIVVTGVLEQLEWDRWALQQWHRVLRVGGLLVLVVPSLVSLAPAALMFVASRVLSRVVRRLSGSKTPRQFAGRRYTRAMLEPVLASLYYEVERAGRPVASVWDSHHVIVARRLPDLSERIASGEPPEPAAFVRDYETDQRRFVDIRARWMLAHPERVSARCEPFDLARHAGARVLVLAPHADDELVGSAGTLLRLIEHGAKVSVIHATDGSAGAALYDAPENVRTTLRLEEARVVGAALGVTKLHFWKQDNRAFRVLPEAVELMKQVLLELQPDLIFTPFVTDIHPDHFTLNRILEAALAAAPFDASRCQMCYSEIWSLVPGNAYCDISAQERTVERLIELYLTAMKIDDLSHLCEKRAYYQSCRLLGRPGFVETFFMAPASEHAALMSSVSPPA